MKTVRNSIRAAATAILFAMLPSLAHAHTFGGTAHGVLHDVTHAVLGAQHLFVVPALVLVLAVAVFGAFRYFRSVER